MLRAQETDLISMNNVTGGVKRKKNTESDFRGMTGRTWC